MRERIKFETLLSELQDLVVDMISDTQDQYKNLRSALKTMDTKKAEELITKSGGTIKKEKGE